MKWSYSDWEIFDQCPRKYYHLKVVKDFKRDQNIESLQYGRDLHTAAELYIKDGMPLEPKYAFLQESLDTLKKLKGKKFCEYKLGLTRKLEPCGFWDKDMWWRGVADLYADNGGTGFLVDYKTGKNSKYADKGQLELLTLAIFKHHPYVHTVKAGLLFVIAKDMIPATFKREQEAELWWKWIQKIQRLEGAFKNDTWNAVPNFSCKDYCPITSCEHHGRSQYYRR